MLSYKYLNKTYQNEDISEAFKLFYDFFYDNLYDYDVNGFNLIFLRPPIFSGLGQSMTNYPIYNNFFVYAVDFTPLDFSVSTSQIDLSNSLSFKFPSGIGRSGTVSVSYIDDTNNSIYEFHNRWLIYIERCISGHVSPSSEVVEKNQIDYYASIFTLKFKFDMKTPVLATKSLGIFPESLSSKDIIGTRGDHKLSLITINYSCLFHLSEVVKKDGKSIIYNEIVKSFLSKK